MDNNMDNNMDNKTKINTKKYKKMNKTKKISIYNTFTQNFWDLLIKLRTNQINNSIYLYIITCLHY